MGGKQVLGREMNKRIVSNGEVRQAVIGTPADHKHLRLLLQIGEDWWIFPEAILANLTRAFIIGKTHPQRQVIHLES